MNSFTRGDVLYGAKKSDAIHPILLLGDRDEDFFYGIMLTSKKRPDNIALPAGFIEKTNFNGAKYEFQYRNTHFVGVLLLKKIEWAPFRKIGAINKGGIRYIEKFINLRDPIVWEEYLKR
jgi:hypothetical protein